MLLALTEGGIAREEAYKIVQENAMKCWQEELNFKEMLLKDDRVFKNNLC